MSVIVVAVIPIVAVIIIVAVIVVTIVMVMVIVVVFIIVAMVVVAMVIIVVVVGTFIVVVINVVQNVVTFRVILLDIRAQQLAIGGVAEFAILTVAIGVDFDAVAIDVDLDAAEALCGHVGHDGVDHFLLDRECRACAKDQGSSRHGQEFSAFHLGISRVVSEIVPAEPTGPLNNTLTRPMRPGPLSRGLCPAP
jgi:hypothetical protein